MLMAVALLAGCGVHVGVEDDKEKPAAEGDRGAVIDAEADGHRRGRT